MRRVLAIVVALVLVPGQVWAGQPRPGASPDGASGPAAGAIDPAVPTPAPSYVPEPPPPAEATRAAVPQVEYIAPPLQYRQGGQSPSLLRPQLEPPRGIGMMITGVGLAVPGTATFVLLGRLVRAFSTLCVDNCDDSSGRESGGVGLFVFGGMLFAGGVTLFTVGAVRNSRWREWKDRQQVLAPHVGRTAFGTWTPGLALRF